MPCNAPNPMAGKVDCTITVDVEEITLHKVTYVSVGQRMDAHHTFEFRMTLDDARQETFTGEARKYLGKQAVVKINFAPQTPSSKDLHFEGLVTDAVFSRSQGGSPEITVSGYSLTYLLNGDGWNRSFSAKSLQQIVDEVCKDAVTLGLRTQVAPKYSAQLPYVVQYEESDHQFLARMAARYGEWFYFDGTTMLFGKPSANEATEELVFGGNLFSFDIGVALRRNNLELEHWDHNQAELLKAKGDTSDLRLNEDTYGKLLKNPAADLFGPGDLSMLGHVIDQGDLDARTAARIRSNGSGAVVMRGVSDHARLRPGKLIKVSGPVAQEGSTSSTEYGEFIVTSVSHSSSNGNYQNHFEAIPTANDMVPTSAWRQPVCDPQSAHVIEVDDPDKLGRVRVRFHWQQGGPELSPWIRVLSAHAHKQGGLYLIPEIGDEVLVDFEFNDPEQPYVTGSLFNGKAKPDAAWADERNDVKAFRTKGGNEVLITDKAGKESVVVRNKDGKNEVILALGSQPSITIRTEGKLVLDAKTIELKCQDLKVDAQAGGEINTGAKLDLSAANMKIDGSALVEVKGGLIKLN